MRQATPAAQQSHDDRLRALSDSYPSAAHLRATEGYAEEAEWSRRDIPLAVSLGLNIEWPELRMREEVGGYSAPQSRGQGAAAATS